MLNNKQNIDSQTLLALSSLIGKFCSAENIDFMKCKQIHSNPRKCLKKGKDVVTCVMSVLQKAEKNANAELLDFRLCLQATSNDFVKCRELRKRFEEVYNDN
jgi:hypothetical protein